LYFQQVLRVSPLISGLALVPAALLLSLLNPRAGRLLDQIGPRRTIVIGMSLIIVGFLLLGLLVGHMPLPVAIFGAMLTEAGNAFVMMPATTAGANALPNALISDGTAAVTTVRQLLGSSGVAIATLILTQVQLATGSVLTAFTATFLTFAGVGVVGLLLGLTLPDHR
ncbi:MAG: MFS transporter, partial [Lactobacillus sp.]|nr:MFS transporter [Lactobacillus sp.]